MKRRAKQKFLQGKPAAEAMTGRTIVRADLHAWDDSEVLDNPAMARTCHTLVLHLDNGARVEFLVEENELMASGVSPIYCPNG